MSKEWSDAAKDIATTLSEFIVWLGDIPEDECQKMAPVIKKNVAEWHLLREETKETP